MRSRQILATAEAGDAALAKDLAAKMNSEQPNNPDRLTLLGDVLVIAGEKGAAMNAYNAALKINPRTIPAINSLAWIHATSDTETLRNGSRAVELAEFLMNAPGARENSEFLMTLADVPLLLRGGGARRAGLPARPGPADDEAPYPRFPKLAVSA